MRYPVIIRPDDGQFTATFPDVPEAVTFGATPTEARGHAVDALLTVFDAFMAGQRDIPAPSAGARGVDTIELPALETSKIELYRAMRAQKVGKAELARRLQWHRPQVDRVLDVHHPSQIDQIEAALGAVGKRLSVMVLDKVDPAVVPRRRGRKVVRYASSGRAVPARGGQLAPEARRTQRASPAGSGPSSVRAATRPVARKKR